jgi:hypothetical protein
VWGSCVWSADRSSRAWPFWWSQGARGSGWRTGAKRGQRLPWPQGQGPMRDLPHPPRIPSEPLAHKAAVYLRRSTEAQVKHKEESQRHEFALADRARALGGIQVERIGTELGCRAGLGAAQREGPERQGWAEGRNRCASDSRPISGRQPPSGPVRTSILPSLRATGARFDPDTPERLAYPSRDRSHIQPREDRSGAIVSGVHPRVVDRAAHCPGGEDSGGAGGTHGRSDRSRSRGRRDRVR